MIVFDKRVRDLSNVLSQEELKEVLTKVLDEVIARLGMLFVGTQERGAKLEDLLKGRGEFPEEWREVVCSLMYGSISSLAFVLAWGILFKRWEGDVLKDIASVLYLLNMVLIEWEMGEDILDVVRWLRNVLSDAVVVDMSKVEMDDQEIEDVMKKEPVRIIVSE